MRGVTLHRATAAAWVAVVSIASCGGRSSIDASGVDAADQDATTDRSQDVPADVPSTSCLGDSGVGLAAWIQDAGIQSNCQSMLANVVVVNTGPNPIGPITVARVIVPSANASWAIVPSESFPAIGSGQKAVITVSNGGACAPMSCSGLVGIEIDIEGAGIAPGSRACGVATVYGC